MSLLSCDFSCMTVFLYVPFTCGFWDILSPFSNTADGIRILYTLRHEMSFQIRTFFKSIEIAFSPATVRSEKYSARGVRKVTTGITGLWQPSVHCHAVPFQTRVVNTGWLLQIVFQERSTCSQRSCEMHCDEVFTSFSGPPLHSAHFVCCQALAGLKRNPDTRAQAWCLVRMVRILRNRS